MQFSPEQIADSKLGVVAAIGRDWVVEIAQVGSTYISGEGNDLDLVVLCSCVGRTSGEILSDLAEHGYRDTGDSSGVDDEFITFRKADVNLMVTFDPSFMAEFQVACEVCKYVHKLFGMGAAKMAKEDRIKIHRIIMNGEGA